MIFYNNYLDNFMFSQKGFVYVFQGSTSKLLKIGYTRKEPKIRIKEW